MYPRVQLLLLIFVSVKCDVNVERIFEGAYTECLLKLSYVCLQKKTLNYLKLLNGMSEVSVFGDYVKFVKFNSTKPEEDKISANLSDTSELTSLIDKTVDSFFETHSLKVRAMGRELSMTSSVNEFVGRKKRKGGGGGGDHGDHDSKKKIMMMAMMCMKMKMMMMIPAMMGMMGMMSFKGMMFSMMSFMISKMMLVMKLLEKRGGLGGGGGGNDGGWAAGGGGGGAWMPAGGQDYAGGGYDANGQWQSRSILEKEKNKPTVTYVAPTVRKDGNDIKDKGFNEIKHRIIKRNADDNIIADLDAIPADYDLNSKKDKATQTISDIMKIMERNDRNTTNNLKDNKTINSKSVGNTTLNQSEDSNKANIRQTVLIKKLIKAQNAEEKPAKNKTRNKRDIIDIFQNSYRYILSRLFGTNRRTNPKYRIINGIKYVYYPFKLPQKVKTPKEMNNANNMKIITAEDFNKGEIMEVQSRMNRKKFNKMKNDVNETIDDNPWE